MNSVSDKMILAIDQGTTSSRAILFSKAGDILDIRQKELKLYCPQKGWVEQDPHDIWLDTLWALRAIVTKIGDEGAAKIAGIGITNQRETTLVWDRKTGEPVYNAIVWQDRRTAELCSTLKAQGYEDLVRKKTGLLLDPYFSATKIAWILENVQGARARAEAGDLVFGTIDSWIIWCLTRGKSHVSDITNASRTMLYNINDRTWDEELLKLFNIPSAMLPTVYENVADFGAVAPDILGRSYKIGGVAGDQQAALIGQACFKPGMMKATYGTGCFALLNIGNDFLVSKNRLLTTPAYCLDGHMQYALEGSIFTAGAAVQWLRDNLGVIKNAEETEHLARSVPDNNGVYFVPAFTGLGAPYWDASARAVISGLTRESNAAHIVRAALEAQAYQTYDLIDAFQKDSGVFPDVMRIDGGLAHNGFVCEFLAGMMNMRLELPKVIETTAYGAALLAGLHAGLYQDLDEVQKSWKVHKTYQPEMSAIDRERLHGEWMLAVEQVVTIK